MDPDTHETNHVTYLRAMANDPPGVHNRPRIHEAADYIEHLEAQIKQLGAYIMENHCFRADETTAEGMARLDPLAVAPGGPGCTDPAGEGAVDAAIRLLKFAAGRTAFAPGGPAAELVRCEARLDAANKRLLELAGIGVKAWALWQLLDDVDTADDIAKENDKHFRELAMQAAAKRNKYFVSEDGQTLVPPRGESTRSWHPSVIAYRLTRAANAYGKPITRPEDIHEIVKLAFGDGQLVTQTSDLRGEDPDRAMRAFIEPLERVARASAELRDEAEKLPGAELSAPTGIVWKAVNDMLAEQGLRAHVREPGDVLVTTPRVYSTGAADNIVTVVAGLARIAGELIAHRRRAFGEHLIAADAERDARTAGEPYAFALITNSEDVPEWLAGERDNILKGLRQREERAYLAIKRGEEIEIHTDYGEPEDNSFIRDWAWVPAELQRAYDAGKAARGIPPEMTAAMEKVLADAEELVKRERPETMSVRFAEVFYATGPNNEALTAVRFTGLPDLYMPDDDARRLLGALRDGANAPHGGGHRDPLPGEFIIRFHPDKQHPADLAAIAAYTDAIDATHPQLAADLRERHLSSPTNRIMLWQALLASAKPSRTGLPLTVALDFDETVYAGPWTRADECTGKPHEGAIDKMKQWISAGWRIVLHTCRLTAPYEGAPFEEKDHDPERTKGVLIDWFMDHGLTLEEMKHVEMWTRPGKPWAQVYLDDKAVRFPGFWPPPRRRAPEAE